MGGFEIRELIIKATIVSDAADSKDNGGSNSASGNNESSPNETIIKSCVEIILEILKEKDGR